MEVVVTSEAHDTSLDKSMDDEQDEEQVTLPGFRFHPTDEELVGFYLRRKVDDKPVKIEELIIKQIDIYKCDPWDLPKSISVGDKEWYVFCLRGRKYRNSLRPNRVTGSGFWKATGIDKPIYSVGDPHACIGLKKSLVYYRGSSGKGTKTDWMMHEFRLPTNGSKSTRQDQTGRVNSTIQEAEVWTICRIFKRIPPYRKYTPNLINTASVRKQSQPSDSISKTCSSESDNTKQQWIVNLGDSSAVIQNMESKPVIEQYYSFSSFAPTPFPACYGYSRFWNPGGEDVFASGSSWDELRSVVELASNPSSSFGCP